MAIEVPIGLKLLNPVPIEEKMIVNQLSDLTNNPTLYVGFSGIWDKYTGQLYYVSAGTVGSWVFTPQVTQADQNNRGYFIDDTSLQSSIPVGQDGWFAIVGSTDSVWIWDSGTTSWVDSGNTPTDTATEIHNSTDKGSPVDADELGLIDSAAGWILKKLSLSNLYLYLKGKFDFIYSTFSGEYADLSNKPDLTVYAEKTNVLELDNTDVFTPSGDYQPATKKYVDDKTVNNKGWFADESALTTAYPVGQSGWYAILGTTDTMWTWDADTTAWVDTGSSATVSGFTDLNDTPADYTGQAGKTVIVNATEDGLEFGTASGSSGGHTILDNGSALPEEGDLDFEAANGESIAADDAVNGKTIITPKLRALNDYDATGEQAASVIQRNSSDDGYEAGQSAYDDKTILTPVASITADGQIAGLIIPAGYRFIMTAVNETANAITAFKLTDGTNDLFTAADVSESGFTVFAMDLTKFDQVNDLDIYAAATTWNSGNLTLYFRFERLI